MIILPIARHLNIAGCDIKRVEEWANCFFVVLMTGRPQFVSKKVAKPEEPTDATEVKFNSSCLKSGSYSKYTNTLTVTFNNGLSYDYYNVLPAVWELLSDAANSAGKMYNQLVKGKYPGKKLN